MALNGAASHPHACQALSSMLSRNALNPADISVLYRNYSSHEPPPIDLIRNPQFLGKTIDTSLHILKHTYLLISSYLSDRDTVCINYIK